MEIWRHIQMIFSMIGGAIGYFLGGFDGFIYTLITFAVIDYFTGILCAISDKKLSSKIGFRGIFKKCLIFIMVGMAHILDFYIINGAGVLRTAVIFFYISNEGVSILENAAHLGLPIPKKLKEILKQIKNDKE